MSIGDNLRIIRNKKDISQQDIADFLGIARNTYAKWEDGKVDVKSHYLPKLAEVLQVEITDLIREKASEIVINLNNSDNKDDSINAGAILILTDKEAIDQLVEVMKKKFGKE